MNLDIPSKKQCYRLMREMGMLNNIVAHSEQVCRVALCLTDHLDRRGVVLNRELIRASALLHDITKTRSFETKENHAQTGSHFLSEKGFPEVGRVVGQHVRLDTYVLPGTPREVEVINYADKRVLHDRIVSLKERMGYIVERYGGDSEIDARILMLYEKTRNLEKRLFEYVPFAPADLKGEVEKLKIFKDEHRTSKPKIVTRF